MPTGYPDHEGNKSSVYSRSEWSVEDGTEKSIESYAANIASGISSGAEYQVPAGKTLYIMGMAFSISSFLAADREKNQIGTGRLYRTDDSQTFVWLGGNGGAGLDFNKAHVFDAGETVRIYVVNNTGHAANIGVSAWGYEV